MIRELDQHINNKRYAYHVKNSLIGLSANIVVLGAIPIVSHILSDRRHTLVLQLSVLRDDYNSEYYYDDNIRCNCSYFQAIAIKRSSLRCSQTSLTCRIISNPCQTSLDKDYFSPVKHIEPASCAIKRQAIEDLRFQKIMLFPILGDAGLITAFILLNSWLAHRVYHKKGIPQKTADLTR